MKSIRLADIVALFPAAKTEIRNQSTTIDGPVSVQQTRNQASKTKVSWLNDKTASTFSAKELDLGLLILTEASFEKLKTANCNFLIVENPRAAFFTIVSNFFASSKREPRVESSARIDPSSKIGTGCYIGHGVIIEENCEVGDNTIILHNTCVLAGTLIGKNVTIGCNNTIGNYGFGYEKDEGGQYNVLEHLGRVIIHDDVEIHNNTCIDRGVLDNTEIFENVKIDNLVHIAHGVIIERNSLIIANAMVAGSSRIGENSWIAPSASIKNKITIARNTFTGIGAVVLKDTKENEVYIGNPAITMDEQKKWSELKKKLSSL